MLKIENFRIKYKAYSLKSDKITHLGCRCQINPSDHKEGYVGIIVFKCLWIVTGNERELFRYKSHYTHRKTLIPTLTQGFVKMVRPA